MTLMEIAQDLGLSPSTVSRVLNGIDKAASPKTRTRIWNKVNETGYIPNKYARGLKLSLADEPTAASKKVCCIFARTVDTYIDPFFTELMQAIEKEAFSMGYTVRTALSTNELISGGILEDASLRGAIVLGRIDEKSMRLLEARFSYIAYAGLNTLPYNIDQVVSSGYSAAFFSVEYLKSKGHSAIAYVGETNDEQRYQGYFDGMQRFFPFIGKSLTFQASLTPSSSYETVKQMLKRKASFTAIFCANDDTAMGALRAFKECNIRVPKDIAVMGVGDIKLSRYFSPMLTTVHIPISEMGRQVAISLIDRIETKRHFSIKIDMPNNICEREST